MIPIRLLPALLLFAIARPAPAQTLTISLEDSQPGMLELRFNRMLSVEDGRLAILLDDIDLTAVFRPASMTWALETGQIPLPGGDGTLRVYVVSLAGEWRQIAELPVTIPGEASAPPAAEPVAPEPPRAGTEAGPNRFQPSVSLTYKSQHISRFAPLDTVPERPAFDDVTMQSTLDAGFSRRGFTLNSNFALAGASNAAERLRFNERGSDAPGVDLASHLTSFGRGGLVVQAGHLEATASRHLMDSFSSRGIRFRLPLGSRADFTLSRVNGTQIVGWNNFFGLDRWSHQLGAATLGLELAPRPGSLRLELSALAGSLLPLTGYTQGALTDAERSSGASLRLISSTFDNRVRLDGAYTRSAFRNPADATLLDSGEDGLAPLPLVQVRRETRPAYYADAAVDVVRNAFANTSKPLTITTTFRRERVDPQFRSVGAAPQADRQQNQALVTIAAGPLTGSASHLRSNDNLFGLASLMRTLTRQTDAALSIPVSALWAKPPMFARYLPQLTYAYLGLHQLGTGAPLGFDSESQLPDQQNTNHNATLDWTIGQWRAGYRYNRSLQDNRQPGRELADLINTVNSATFGWSADWLTSAVEVGVEDVRAREVDMTNRTVRLAANNTWNLRRNLALMVNLSLTRLSQFGTINRTRAVEGDAQLTWDLSTQSGARSHARPQLFLRYANRYQSIFDGLFLINALTRAQSVQMGVTFTLQ